MLSRAVRHPPRLCQPSPAASPPRAVLVAHSSAQPRRSLDAIASLARQLQRARCSSRTAMGRPTRAAAAGGDQPAANMPSPFSAKSVQNLFCHICCHVQRLKTVRHQDITSTTAVAPLTEIGMYVQGAGRQRGSAAGRHHRQRGWGAGAAAAGTPVGQWRYVTPQAFGTSKSVASHRKKRGTVKVRLLLRVTPPAAAPQAARS